MDVEVRTYSGRATAIDETAIDALRAGWRGRRKACGCTLGEQEET